MHVAVDEPGHQKRAVQIHQFRRGADPWTESIVGAHVDDLAGANRERLRRTMMYRIGREDRAVAIRTIGGRGRIGRVRRAIGEQRCRREQHAMQSRDSTRSLHR